MVLTTPALDATSTHPLLAAISPAARDRLERLARPVQAAPSLLRQEGDRCDAVTLVGSGRLRVLKRHPNGREITLYTVLPGELCVLEVLAVLVETPYRAEAVVEEAIVGAAVPADTFRALAAEEPAVRAFVDRALEARLAFALDLVGDVALGTLEARLARLVLRRARPTGEARVTHDALARELACAREAVSRLLGGWERGGLVRLGRGHLGVLDAEALARVADAGSAGARATDG